MGLRTNNKHTFFQYSNKPTLQYSKMVRTCTGKAIEL